MNVCTYVFYLYVIYKTVEIKFLYNEPSFLNLNK